MKLFFPFLQSPIELSSDYIVNFVIENQQCFYCAVYDFIQLDKTSQVELLIDDKIVNLSKKVETIVDFTHISLNNKKIQTKVLSILEEKSKEGKNFIRTQELISLLNQYLLELSEELSYGVESYEFSFGSVLKSMGLKVVEDESPPIERLLQYMDFIRDLDGEKLFVLVNIRSYFIDSEIEKFYRMVEMKKFYVILLESVVRDKIYNEKTCILDKDMCLIC